MVFYKNVYFKKRLKYKVLQFPCLFHCCHCIKNSYAKISSCKISQRGYRRPSHSIRSLFKDSLILGGDSFENFEKISYAHLYTQAEGANINQFSTEWSISNNQTAETIQHLLNQLFTKHWTNTKKIPHTRDTESLDQYGS